MVVKIEDYAGVRNATAVTVGDVRLYFSYETCIAFRKGGQLTVSENCWGTTTGKHINAVSGGRGAPRLPRAEFEAALEAALNGEEKPPEPAKAPDPAPLTPTDWSKVVRLDAAKFLLYYAPIMADRLLAVEPPHQPLVSDLLSEPWEDWSRRDWPGYDLDVEQAGVAWHVAFPHTEAFHSLGQDARRGVIKPANLATHFCAVVNDGLKRAEQTHALLILEQVVLAAAQGPLHDILEDCRAGADGITPDHVTAAVRKVIEGYP